MSEYPIQDKHETFQMIWAKRFFVLSLVLLGIVFSLQGVGIIEFPVTSTKSQKEKVKPVRVGGLLCQEPVWDFGLVDSVKNSRLSHEFTLVNESKETVTIQKIHSTCGCMVAEDFDKELTPGKSTKIKVNVQLPTTPQLFHKNLAVQIEKGVVPLDVRGEIAANKNLYGIPANINFGVIRVGETKERIVQILRYDLSSINFVDAKGSIDGLTCKLQKLESNEKHKILLKISLDANHLSSGDFDGYVEIHTDSITDPDYKIPVVAKIKNS
jgi:hypothetical protein